jgi:hypothetical protein
MNGFEGWANFWRKPSYKPVYKIPVLHIHFQKYYKNGILG